MDHVIAERGARLFLPARKEGIIPGASNLRLPRFVGARPPARRFSPAGSSWRAPPRATCCGRGRRPRGDGRRDRGRGSRRSRARGSSTPPPTGAPCASRRSRSTSSARTWRPTRASRRSATSARRSSSNLERHWNAHGAPAVILDAIETARASELRRCSSSGCGRRWPAARRARRRSAARLRAAGVTAAEDIGSLDDLARLPFTEKADLREHYPFGLLAVPRERLVRVHASSGTGGKPTVVGYTAATSRCGRGHGALHGAAGVRPGMSSTTPTATGSSPAGSASTTAPSGSARRSCRSRAARPRRQLLLLRDLQAQVLCSHAVLRAHDRRGARGRGRRPRGARRSSSGSSAPSRGRRRCATSSSARLGLRRAATSTGSRRSSARAWRPSAEAARRARTSTRTTSSSRCRPARSRLGEHGELVFTTLTKEALPLSATAPATRDA